MEDIIFSNDELVLPKDQGNSNVAGEIYAANEQRFVEAHFNEPLTVYARGWRDPSNIIETLDFFAPIVRTSRRFTYGSFVNAEEFYSETDDIRPIGTDFKHVEYTSVKILGQTKDKGLTIVIDLDEIADDPGWEESTVGKLRRRLARNEFRRTWALLSAAAVDTAKTWDVTAGKDPDQDIQTELIAASNVSGLRPNRIGFGDTAWDKRGVSHRAQNTAGGYASAGYTQEQLASFLNVDRTHVSRERYQSSASAKTAIANDKVIMFMAEQGIGREDPSNIKRFISAVEGGGDFRVYTQQLSAKLYAVTVEHYSDIVITSTLGIRQFTIS